MFKFITRLFNRPDLGAILNEGAVLVDVRTKSEYKGGHLKNALNIPLNLVEGKSGQLKKKGKPVILYCKSGARSRMATRILKSKGIEAFNGGSLFSMQRILSK